MESAGLDLSAEALQVGLSPDKEKPHADGVMYRFCFDSHCLLVNAVQLQGYKLYAQKDRAQAACMHCVELKEGQEATQIS